LATAQEFITPVVEQPGPQGAQPGLLIKVSKTECGMVADHQMSNQVANLGWTVIFAVETGKLQEWSTV